MSELGGSLCHWNHLNLRRNLLRSLELGDDPFFFVGLLLNFVHNFVWTYVVTFLGGLSILKLVPCFFFFFFSEFFWNIVINYLLSKFIFMFKSCLIGSPLLVFSLSVFTIIHGVAFCHGERWRRWVFVLCFSGYLVTLFFYIFLLKL